jgi:hypothetical protein
MKVFFYLFVFAAISFSLPAWSTDLSAEEKLSDLHQLVARMKSGYGPLEYKKSALGIDIDSLQKKYEQRIVATKSNGEFYYEILKFIAEFKDGHFRAILPGSHRATLPLRFDLVRGKVLIDEINRQKLPETEFRFDRGDELIEFNGRPVADEIADLMQLIPNGSELTARRYAVMSLTVRSAARYPVPPLKTVKLKIRRGESSVIDEANLKWTYDGDPINEFSIAKSGASLLKSEAKSQAKSHAKSIGPVNRGFTELSTFDEVKIYSHPEFERKFLCSGQTRIEIPADATIIMRDPFVAYYHPTSKGNIGYLRIPHYSPQLDENTEDWQAASRMRFMQYEYAVSKLEANTVALVIDQQHNCGGFVFFMHDLATLFIGKSFEPIKFELLANKEEYLKFVDWASGFKNTLLYEGLTRISEIIKKAWDAGQKMTSRVGIDGIEVYHPNRVRYTKPILVLIDELSGSGGDAFPALMQGLGRVQLLGETTMGLGGSVWPEGPLYYSRITPELTTSLFFHPNGTAIENVGAIPDIHYQPSRNDFLYGYREFRDFYTQEVLKLVP